MSKVILFNECLKFHLILFSVLKPITFDNLPSFQKVKFSKNWQIFLKWELPLQKTKFSRKQLVFQVQESSVILLDEIFFYIGHKSCESTLKFKPYYIILSARIICLSEQYHLFMILSASVEKRNPNFFRFHK